MRVLFALPGLHRYDRGAEVAFTAIASELARSGDTVTLIGSGEPRPGAPYRFMHAPSVRRERFESWPSVPVLRNDCSYEELTFLFSLLRRFRPCDYDVTLTCSYPFVNWALRRPAIRGARPPHIFITQNGDWPAFARSAEYRFFGCEGLVCTNPDYFSRNQQRWRCALIPNGVDCERFTPGAPTREDFGIPANRFVILMVSALISSKRVALGIDAVSAIPDAHLVVAGDGPLREEIDRKAAERLPGRFTRLTVPAERMPALYRSADVFMHLSNDESFGNVYVEALASGLPVVAQDSARTRWIVGEGECLYAADDPACIAASLEQARCATPEQRAQRARKASAFSWANIGAQYRDFIRQVVASDALSAPLPRGGSAVPS